MSTAAVRTNIAISTEVPWDIAVHLQEIYRQLGNHTQAFALIKQAATAAGNTVNNFAEVVNSGGGPTPTATGIAVNNQSGQTSYATVAGDNLTLIVFSDASPVAVSLTGQAPPWACFISNQGTGTTTLTPQTGTINYAGNPGAASLALPSGYSCIVAFDGTNWWADVDTGGDATSIRGVPVSATAPTDGQVLEYDAASALYVPATGMTNPMTDVGDLIVGGAAGAPARLGAGTSGNVLTSNGPGVAPSYQPGASGGVSSLNTLTGALSLVAGSNVTITPSGSNLTIAASGGGGASGWTPTPPSSPTSTGTAGQYSSDGAHAYLCYAANMWGKFPMSPLFENPPVTDGLLLYYDANMYSFTDGASVGSMTDLSGNGFTAVAQSGGAVFHTNQINGRAALSFPGTSTGRYNLSNGFLAQNITVFVVAKAAAVGNYDILAGAGSSWQIRLQGNGTGVSPMLIKSTVAVIGESTAIVPVNTFAQFNGTYSSPTGAWAFRVAQAAAGSGTYAGTAPSMATTTLGWEPTTDDFNGEIAEVIAYNRVLTSAEIASVEAFLFAKYGV